MNHSAHARNRSAQTRWALRSAAGLALAASLASPALAQKVLLATSMGDIVIELDAKKAPKSVENFMQYVKAGHYNGTIFHRVIDGFMIQGGGYDENLSQRPTRAPIVNES
ncbi:MAG TPA: peptidylprolyl isomerase, partial [Burkholderiaceae bacterium]|nr:peptidylprolyl isomerase [Burkholderiaceae bacterium]